jgi:hypothetical protein
MDKKYISKINKYVEYFETKAKIILAERCYNDLGYRLKYILECYDSDKLIIVFSACTREGIKARYNYNRTIKKFPVNKLFILDDFGYDHRGAYYLGHNNDFKIQELVIKLIKMVKKQLNIRQTVYVGSSKGGYAALYFGLPDPKSIIIAGAPQYKLGNYLNAGIYIKNCLEYIVGNKVTDEKIEMLNNLLRDRILSCKNNRNKVYLHFSKVEHTYRDHIKYLLDDLKFYGYEYHVDVGEYKKHADISLYFPKYLVDIIDRIVRGEVIKD